MEMVT